MTLDPRRLHSLLREIAASKVPVKAFSLGENGELALEFYPLPFPTTATAAKGKAGRAPATNAGGSFGTFADVPEAWDLDGVEVEGVPLPAPADEVA